MTPITYDIATNIWFSLERCEGTTNDHIRLLQQHLTEVLAEGGFYVERVKVEAERDAVAREREAILRAVEEHVSLAMSMDHLLSCLRERVK